MSLSILECAFDMAVSEITPMWRTYTSTHTLSFNDSGSGSTGAGTIKCRNVAMSTLLWGPPNLEKQALPWILCRAFPLARQALLTCVAVAHHCTVNTAQLHSLHQSISNHSWNFCSGAIKMMVQVQMVRRTTNGNSLNPFRKYWLRKAIQWWTRWFFFQST